MNANKNIDKEISSLLELIQVYKESAKGNKSRSYAYKMSDRIQECQQKISKLESHKTRVY